LPTDVAMSKSLSLLKTQKGASAVKYPRARKGAKSTDPDLMSSKELWLSS